MHGGKPINCLNYFKGYVTLNASTFEKRKGKLKCMSSFWNERYREEGFAYGEEPNVFFAEQMDSLTSGSLILPCEGEGRNAVYAASKGWEVNAFDTSVAGKSKALQLANRKNVRLSYTIQDVEKAAYPLISTDVIAFIYAHFPATIRRQIHRKVIGWLKPGGRIILEAFNPLQLQNTSGGPKELSMLYSKEMLLEDFAELQIELLETQQIELKEGKYHNGKADVIRFVGIKK